MNLKDELRKSYRQKRVAFCSQNDKAELDKNLATQILSVLPSESQKYWGTYSAYKSEANPYLVTTKVLNWSYPVVCGNELEFYKLKENEKWVPNQFGILEPQVDPGKKVFFDQIEGILIPGLAFDEKGYRLGSGFGFYDRALKEFKGLKIGVCYSIQYLKGKLPYEEHDIAVDIIVTEQKVIPVS